MTFLSRTLPALALAAVVAIPALAQEYSDPRGFRLKPAPIDPRDALAAAAPEATLMRTARCVAEDRPDEVSAYLLTLPGSPAEEQALGTFEKKVTRCMPEMDMSMVGNTTRARGLMTMSFDHSAMRGALAESLMREEEIAISPERLSLGDDGMFVAERFHGARSEVAQRTFALGFAGCVMGNNPNSMAALLSTDPGSAEEKKAIVEMAPSFGQCVMEGQELKLSAPTLRNQLAEVIYYAMNTKAADDA